MQRVLGISICFAGLIISLNGECPNGCSGRGRCVFNDICMCDRNWIGPDCNERACQFGLAWVDTPKGDLDASASISGPGAEIARDSELYPYGTTEQWPEMQDSDYNVLDDTAHFYRECSNNGVCDRSTGQCICHENYYGVACQRRMCPGHPVECSGHGRCMSKRQLAAADNGNVYRLWDRDISYGCSCDGGYYGADCSLRKCKYGSDPMYLDDVATIRFPSWDFAVLTTDPNTVFTSSIVGSSNPGYWSIRFFDAYGEDWITQRIVAGASCQEVLDALEALPNNVIPKGMTTCVLTSKTSSNVNDGNWYQDIPKTNLHLSKRYDIFYNMSIWEAITSPLEGDDSVYTAITLLPGSADHRSYAPPHLNGYIYRIRFFGNPGGWKQPEISLHTEDYGALSLVSPGYKVLTKVWTDGQRGEYDDHFADHCEGVTVQIGHYVDDTPSIAALGQGIWLEGMTADEKKKLKRCLGSSDFDTSNNVDTMDWDYGTFYYPHIIKLVRSVTSFTDGGYFAVIYYTDDSNSIDSSGSTGVFRLLNPFRIPDGIATDNFEVYTTKGTLALTSNESQAVFSFASRSIYMVNSTYETHLLSTFDGDLSCEINEHNAAKMQHILYCLNKTDIITLLAFNLPGNNPPNINFYKVERLYTAPAKHLKEHLTSIGFISNRYTDPEKNQYQKLHYMTHTITTDISTNWGSSRYDGSLTSYPTFRVYKFFPAEESTYKVTGECSHRGICNTKTGLCNCFNGYTGDACSVLDALAI